MDLIDNPTRIRPGEELDLKVIEGYLKESIPGLSGNLLVKQFPFGYSNLTYLLQVGDRELVLRRPPFGRKAKTAHDMGREFRILSALKPVFPYCPRPLVYMEDDGLIGSPFYVMERIKGIILRKQLPDGLEFTPERMRTLCENLLDVHLLLHTLDYKTLGMEGFGKPQGYVKRQVAGWSERYKGAWTDDAPTFEKVMQWLHDRMPPDFPQAAVIHNDFKFDNVVLNPQDPLEIIGVLDWEMATIGDPLMDLGCSLAYWIQSDDPLEFQAAGTQPSSLPGALTRAELVKRYGEKRSISVDQFNFYSCFGLFRLAAIAQQIYYRFYHGQTKDQRFQRLIFAVHVLEAAARRTIEEGRI